MTNYNSFISWLLLAQPFSCLEFCWDHAAMCTEAPNFGMELVKGFGHSSNVHRCTFGKRVTVWASRVMSNRDEQCGYQATKPSWLVMCGDQRLVMVSLIVYWPYVISFNYYIDWWENLQDTLVLTINEIQLYPADLWLLYYYLVYISITISGLVIPINDMGRWRLPGCCLDGRQAYRGSCRPLNLHRISMGGYPHVDIVRMKPSKLMKTSCVQTISSW